MRNVVTRSNNPFGLVDPFFDEFFTSESNSFNKVMPTDIKEFEDHYEFKVEVPNVTKDNIKLSLDDGYLTIEAKAETVNDVEEAHYVRKERSFSSAKRSFYVGEITNSDIKAKLENGILTLDVNKPSEKAKEIEYIPID